MAKMFLARALVRIGIFSLLFAGPLGAQAEGHDAAVSNLGDLERIVNALWRVARNFPVPDHYCQRPPGPSKTVAWQRLEELLANVDGKELELINNVEYPLKPYLDRGVAIGRNLHANDASERIEALKRKLRQIRDTIRRKRSQIDRTPDRDCRQPDVDAPPRDSGKSEDNEQDDSRRPTYEPVNIPDIPEGPLCYEEWQRLHNLAYAAVHAANRNSQKAANAIHDLRRSTPIGPAQTAAEAPLQQDLDHWDEVWARADAAAKAIGALEVRDCSTPAPAPTPEPSATPGDEQSRAPVEPQDYYACLQEKQCTAVTDTQQLDCARSYCGAASSFEFTDCYTQYCGDDVNITGVPDSKPTEVTTLPLIEDEFSEIHSECPACGEKEQEYNMLVTRLRNRIAGANRDAQSINRLRRTVADVETTINQFEAEGHRDHGLDNTLNEHRTALQQLEDHFRFTKQSIEGLITKLGAKRSRLERCQKKQRCVPVAEQPVQECTGNQCDAYNANGRASANQINLDWKGATDPFARQIDEEAAFAYNETKRDGGSDRQAVIDAGNTASAVATRLAQNGDITPQQAGQYVARSVLDRRLAVTEVIPIAIYAVIDAGGTLADASGLIGNTETGLGKLLHTMFNPAGPVDEESRFFGSLLITHIVDTIVTAGREDDVSIHGIGRAIAQAFPADAYTSGLVREFLPGLLINYFRSDNAEGLSPVERAIICGNALQSFPIQTRTAVAETVVRSTGGSDNDVLSVQSALADQPTSAEPAPTPQSPQDKSVDYFKIQQGQTFQFEDRGEITPGLGLRATFGPAFDSFQGQEDPKKTDKNPSAQAVPQSVIDQTSNAEFMYTGVFMPTAPGDDYLIYSGQQSTPPGYGLTGVVMLDNQTTTVQLSPNGDGSTRITRHFGFVDYAAEDQQFIGQSLGIGSDPQLSFTAFPIGDVAALTFIRTLPGVQFKANIDSTGLADKYDGSVLTDALPRHINTVQPKTTGRAPDAAAITERLPNDGFFHSKGSWGQGFDDQWGLKHIGIKATDRKGNGALWPRQATPVVVAVVDTGIDFGHPDLQGALWVNSKDRPNDNKDNDNNRHIDDFIGWNFVADNNNTRDDNGHGTFVAGIIAATTDNGVGIAGINPWARILPVKVADFAGDSNSVDVAQGIAYAARMGAKVINVSIGGRRLTRIEQAAVKEAAKAGALVVVAAGNESSDVKDYSPAGIDGVITVAATDHTNKRAKYSNWGAKVDIAAPGSDILSLRAAQTDLMQFEDRDYKKGANIIGTFRHYYHLSGTSFAAPHVAGVASLLLALNPHLTAAQVKRMILHSARDIELPGVDQFTGYGLLDAKSALAADPKFFVESRISGVSVVKDQNQQFVRVTGIVDADQFERAWIELGKGKQPDSWRRVLNDITRSINNAPVGDIPATRFRGASTWTIRLVAQHKNGTKRENRFVLNLN